MAVGGAASFMCRVPVCALPSGARNVAAGWKVRKRNIVFSFTGHLELVKRVQEIMTWKQQKYKVMKEIMI